MRNPDAPQNSSSQSSKTKDIGPSVRVLQLNIEGISRTKSECLSRLLHDQEIDIVLLQETHTADITHLTRRGNIPGFELITATYHAKYGTAIFARSPICHEIKVQPVSICTDNIEITTITLGEITISNIYKPPNSKWEISTIPTHSHPCLYIGDFNSHHTSWGYKANDKNGELLVEWAEKSRIFLVFDGKSRGTFKSARWGLEYNPDLIFTSRDPNSLPNPVKRTVLRDFPHTQHRPVLLEMGLKIPIIHSFPVPRWNFKKAKWDDFAKKLDDCVRWIPPTGENYDRFRKLIIAVAKSCIPRGVRKDYIPCWSERTENLWQDFCKTGDREVGHELVKSLDDARKEKWEQTVSNMNFTHSSRKAWHLLRRLTTGTAAKKTPPKVSPNDIAERIVKLSKAPPHKQHTRSISKALKELLSSTHPDDTYSCKVTRDEIDRAIKHIAVNKACGEDGVFPEFIRYCGPRTREWIAKFFTSIIDSGKIPLPLKFSKVVAILKPEKPDDKAESYRPIALLSVVYKLLERVLYNRISKPINAIIPTEQAGFRPNRSCCDQVLALTTHLEHGFENNMKSSAAFIDLTAAYDTVWRRGLLYKFLKVIPSVKLYNLLTDALTNRTFQVSLGEHVSNRKKLNNGLPQGSVLAPLLFNLYIHDLPDTISRKFGYADDLALVVQSKSMDATQMSLEGDLEAMDNFFTRWRLCPNPSKTEVCCFHLSNQLASKELHVRFRGTVLKHNFYPKYLGVTLDRSLTFRNHLTKTAAKLKTRNNIVQKLTGTTWGATASSLRTTALSLVYSTAEYCAPVWKNSAHVSEIDTQLNHTMRLITGCLKSTPTYWLPALSNIPPPHLRRQKALEREIEKFKADESLPILKDLNGFYTPRLKSRNPPALLAHCQNSPTDIRDSWRKEWESAPPCEFYDLSMTEAPSGFREPRRVWTLLNRLRTGVGNCGHHWKKWGWCDSAACPCGHPEQTVRHMMLECPITKYTGKSEDFETLTSDAVEYLIACNLEI
ncbi:hypothetical protein O0L34_g9105 [Tuta absoluta]|nr:hypothetical protein O0L34_g9105 [Tuta absoluta]